MRQDTSNTKLFDQQAKAAFVVAVLLLGLGGIGFRSAVRELNVVLRKKPVDLRMHLGQIPDILGDWESVEDVPLDAWVRVTEGSGELARVAFEPVRLGGDG